MCGGAPVGEGGGGGAQNPLGMRPRAVDVEQELEIVLEKKNSRPYQDNSGEEEEEAVRAPAGPVHNAQPISIPAVESALCFSALLLSGLSFSLWRLLIVV